MLDQPPACYAIGCPLAGKAKGFVLGAGEPVTAKFSIVLESPYREEVAWRDVSEVEFARRKQAYPGMPVEFLRRGEPVVGRSGAELFGWALKALAVRREDVFLDNTIRCAVSLREPGYPTGATRKRAEACCRQFDRLHADVGLVSIHPAALTREPTPLPVQIRTFEKAIDFSRQGLRVVVLAGGKAAEWWFGSARNPMRWIGHYELETDETRARREERRVEGMETKVDEKKTKKPKRMTAKQALSLLLGKAFPGTPGLIPGVYEDWSISCTLMDSEYKEMLSIVAKKKKVS